MKSYLTSQKFPNSSDPSLQESMLVDSWGWGHKEVHGMEIRE